MVSTEERETRSSLSSSSGEKVADKRRVQGPEVLDGNEEVSAVPGRVRVCCNAGACVLMMSEMEGAIVLGADVGSVGICVELISSEDEPIYVELSALEDNDPMLEDVEILGIVNVGYRVVTIVGEVCEGEGLRCLSCAFRRRGEEGCFRSPSVSEPLCFRDLRGSPPPSVTPGGGFGSGGWYKG